MLYNESKHNILALVVDKANRQGFLRLWGWRSSNPQHYICTCFNTCKSFNTCLWNYSILKITCHEILNISQIYWNILYFPFSKLFFFLKKFILAKISTFLQMKSLVWKAEALKGTMIVLLCKKDSKQSVMVSSEFGKVLLILGISFFFFFFYAWESSIIHILLV